jgi:hypothetical protein
VTIIGEEVCISYLADGYLPKDQRQKILLARGFECRCERCSANPPFPQDIILISDIDGKPVSNDTITTLCSTYDILREEFQQTFGRSTSDIAKIWIERAEHWLVEAHRPPYRLHDYHWLCKHMHTLLRDRHMTMFVSGFRHPSISNKILHYGELLVRAEAAVLQPLDGDKKAVDAFIDDCATIGKVNRWSKKEAKKWEPNVDMIIKRLNE